MKHYITLVSKANHFILNDIFIQNYSSLLQNNNINLVKKTILAPSIAIDFKIESNLQTDHINSLTSNFIKSHKIDFFISNDKIRSPKKLFMSDMDSTIIENECIDEIARTIGKYKIMQEMTLESMKGNSLFEDSLVKRVKLLKGINIKKLEEIYKTKIKLSQGAEILCNTLKSKGVILALASGGFTFFTEKIKEQLGMQYHFSNKLEIIEDKLTGSIIPPIFGSESKLVALNNLASKYNIDLKTESITIGDGANDLPMLCAVDTNFAYKAKEVVEKQTKFNIKHTDLTSVLYALGVTKEEFIT